MAGNQVIVAITANTKGLKKGLGESQGLLGKLGGFAGAAAKTIAGVGAAIGGLAVAGGVARAIKLDQANNKLKALGYTAAQTSGIVNDALKSVQGTAYGLDSAVSVGTQFLASGIKPGKDLTNTLTILANTAAVTGAGFDDLGLVFSQIIGKGKATTQDLNQLAERGIPIFSYLAQKYGVTQAKARTMIEKGLVPASDVMAVLNSHTQGAAVAMGKTFTGSLQNAMAALSRLGALFVAPLLPVLTAGLQFLITTLDSLGVKLKPVAAAWAAWLGGLDVGAFTGQLTNFINTLLTVIPQVFQFMTTVSPLAIIFKAIYPSLPPLLEALSQLGEAFSGVLSAAMPVIINLIHVLTNVLAALAPVIVNVVTFVVGIVTAIVQWVNANRGLASGIAVTVGTIAGLVAIVKIAKAVQLAFIAATYGVQGAMLVTGNAAKIYGVIMTVWGNITKVGSAIQAAFNFVLAANPIGLIITLIAGLIAGLVWFFTQTDLGKKIIGEFWRFLQEAWANISQFTIDTFNNIGKFFSDVWNNIVNFFKGALQFVVDLFLNWTIYGIIIKNWQNILNFFAAIPGWIAGIFKAALNWLKQAGINIILGLYNGVTGFWKNVVGFFKSIPGAIGNFFSGVGKWLYQTGVNMIQGLINGAGSLLRQIGKFFLDLLPDWIRGPFEAALGIHSPSRVFAGYGKNIIAGLVGGLKDGKGTVLNTMDSISGWVANGFAGSMSGAELALAVSGGGGAAGGRTYNVTVNAGVGDPVEIGRQVKKVITAYEKDGGRL